MPLASQPNRGYADYQRIGNFDSGPLWDFNHLGSQLTFTSPTLDVSRFAYIAGRAAEGGSQHQATFTWYQDSLTSDQVGARNLVLNANINNEAQLRLPNLGPFLVITLQPVGAVDYGPFYRLLATNRVHPLEFIPVNQVLIQDTLSNVPAGGNVAVYPVDYYSGPMQVTLNPGAAGSSFLQWQDNANNWRNATLLPATVGADNNIIVVAPPGAWRIQLSNASGAAANFHTKASYTSTGAI